MNILHISPYYPDIETNHAGGVCMGKEIETLSEVHDVYVLTFISQPFDEKLAKKHEGDERWQAVRISKLTRLFHMAVQPWMPNYFAARSSLRFAIKLIRTVRRFNIDAIHAEYTSMGQYLWIKKLFPGLRFNLVEHDVTAQSWERKAEEAEASNKNIRLGYYKNQLKIIKKCERNYCLKADRLLVINEKDKNLVYRLYKRDDCAIINVFSGIEDSVFEDALDNTASGRINKEPYSICFLGQMARPENDRAAKRLVDICAEVKKSIPQLKLYIVGNKPSEELRRKADKANKDASLKEADEIEGKEPKNKEWITVTGFVEDVDSYIKKAKLAVFPLDMGAGIKVKVLRSMALGTPVITGKVGAEGIDECGKVIMLAETDEEYENKIIEVLRENKQNGAGAEVESYSTLSELSCKYIYNNFSWKKSREILLGDIYK